MVEHRALTDEELEEHDRRHDCTGAVARWCPIHGPCTCEDEYLIDGRNDPECHLHGPTSPHAKTDHG